MDVGRQHSWLTRAAALVRAIESGLIVLLLSCLILFSSAQILLRNVFSIGLTWGDGLTRLLVLWLALLGALAASREGRHITMGAVVRWLPKGLQFSAAVVADAFAASVSGLLAWSAFEFVRDSRMYGDVLLGEVPAWWLQAIMPAAFALIAVRYLIRGLRRFGDR